MRAVTNNITVNTSPSELSAPRPTGSLPTMTEPALEEKVASYLNKSSEIRISSVLENSMADEQTRIKYLVNISIACGCISTPTIEGIKATS